MNGRLRMIVVTVASLLITSLVGYAAPIRDGRAVLTGRVLVFTDQGPQAVEGASVLLYNKAGELIARQTTSMDGVFRFERLRAGEYTIEAMKARVGHSRVNVTVRDGINPTISILLQS